jgi:hypothetical protein
MISSSADSRSAATALNVSAVSGHVASREPEHSSFWRTVSTRNVRNAGILALGTGLGVAGVGGSLRLAYEFGTAMGIIEHENSRLAVFGGGVLGAASGVIGTTLVVGGVVLSGQTCRRISSAVLHAISVVAGMLGGAVSGSVAGYAGWRGSSDAIHAAREAIQGTTSNVTVPFSHM